MGRYCQLSDPEIVRQTWELLESEIDELGFELIEVEYGQFETGLTLRLYIDKDQGVTVDNCAEVSRLVSAILDQHDVGNDQYFLEVSSPGIDRPIRKPEDFVRFSGEPVKVKTVAPVGGRKRFKGTLTGFEDGMISVEISGERISIHIENIKMAQLDR
jgi:ribosome maturation factor RimP